VYFKGRRNDEQTWFYVGPYGKRVKGKRRNDFKVRIGGLPGPGKKERTLEERGEAVITLSGTAPGAEKGEREVRGGGNRGEKTEASALGASTKKKKVKVKQGSWSGQGWPRQNFSGKGVPDKQGLIGERRGSTSDSVLGWRAFRPCDLGDNLTRVKGYVRRASTVGCGLGKETGGGENT